MTATVVLEVPVAAPVERVWDAVTDWVRQGEWMTATTVRTTSGDGRGVGAGLWAFTGVGRVGVVDTMEITLWEPPRRCHVVHTGRVVRGTGAFEVHPAPGGAVFHWREDLELPLGAIGRIGWPIVRPVFEAGVRRSLRAFARWVEAGCPPA